MKRASLWIMGGCGVCFLGVVCLLHYLDRPAEGLRDVRRPELLPVVPTLRPGAPVPVGQPGEDEGVDGVGTNGEAVFAEFGIWLERFRGSPDGARERLLEEGVRLARWRAGQMRRLIRTDPERALLLSVGVGRREGLPAAVLAHLEEPLDARGDLEVACALEHEGGGGRFLRKVRVGDRVYEAYVYGRREAVSSLRSVPLHGVVLGDEVALGEDPYREVGPVGLAGRVAAYDPACALGGERVGAEGVVINVGGELRALCGGAHLAEYVGALEEAEEAGGSGGGSPVGGGGIKRVLLMRVDFVDLPGDPFGVEEAAQLVEDLDRFHSDSSYGRAGFEEVGGGSEVTVTLRMPETAAYYGGNNRYNELRSDARSAAVTAGYELAAYDFDVTCMGWVPGFTWGGLGYVGTVGAWIRGRFDPGVAAHELGHNLGLNHANVWDTGGESVIGSGGVSREYGDLFDTMGLATAGPRQFNVCYKELLGWLEAGEIVTVTESGSYRLQAHDDPAATGLRGLRVVKDSLRDYWVEWRQLFVDNRWLMNGVGLRWGAVGNQGSNLLDASPGSANGVEDSALLIGQTFSDEAAGIHITPVWKSETAPGFVDVVVQLGEFPANLPPYVSVAASVAEVSPGFEVQFTGLAGDPNGDLLAYFWDFGDGTFGTNGAVARGIWAVAGEYVVRCEVSDMKGGRASDSVVVRVGTPSTHRVSGRVFADGLPLQGVRVFASSGQMTFTDSDGTYNLVGLPAGSYVLDASRGGYDFSPATFFNPVDVGPDAFGVDFVGGDPADRNRVRLISAGSVWKYLDHGEDLSGGWVERGYDEDGWLLGAAQFGYGDGDESTEIRFGPEEDDKHVTAYFRKRFVVENPGDFSSLDLELLRDDGAVVYLNGWELMRSNMGEGEVRYDTLAATALSGESEAVFFYESVDPGLLVAGTNLLAVEVHQASRDSSDLSFDLRLTGVIASNALVAPGSLWFYLDDGSSQVTEWLRVDHDHSDWAEGAAQLGYGDEDEATLIRFGPNPANKFMTTYFRHLFNVGPETRIGNLTLGLLRDDGAVVYLNGREIFRSNMPLGPIHAGVAALVAEGGIGESDYHETTVDPSLVVPGTNVLAVEVHQHSPGSSDLSFDAYLTAVGTLNSLRGVYVQSPVNTAEFELPAAVAVQIHADAGYGREVRRVELFSAAGRLGEMRTAPYGMVWTNPPPGTHVLTAVAVDDVGETVTSLPVVISVDHPVITAEFVGLGSEWRYLDDGSDQGTEWSGVDFDDGNWAAGRARFGYGGDDEVTVVSFGEEEWEKHMTTYFRRTFQLSEAFELAELGLRLQRDDGAVVYLNGHEIYRSNILPGPVGFDTRAYAAIGGSEEHKWFETVVSAAGIARVGVNVVAVEVHQATPGSTDLGFDLQLVGFGHGDLEIPVIELGFLGPRIVMSWPSVNAGWIMESAGVTDPAGDWAPVPLPVLSTNGRNFVLIIPSRQQQFYRLRKDR